MLLFSRLATMQGAPREVTGFATKMTELVNHINPDFDTTLWQALFGYPGGSVAWSVAIESRAQLAETMGNLMVNETYHEMVAGAQRFASGIPTQDTLRELVHATSAGGEGEGPAVGSFATITTAAPAPGKIADVMEWGVKISDIYAEVTGDNIGFFADAYGTFGQVTWLAGHTDAAAADAAEAATRNSEAYMAEIVGAGDLFEAGSGHVGLLMRMA